MNSAIKLANWQKVYFNTCAENLLIEHIKFLSESQLTLYLIVYYHHVVALHQRSLLEKYNHPSFEFRSITEFPRNHNFFNGFVFDILTCGHSLIHSFYNNI